MKQTLKGYLLDLRNAIEEVQEFTEGMTLRSSCQSRERGLLGGSEEFASRVVARVVLHIPAMFVLPLAPGVTAVAG